MDSLDQNPKAKMKKLAILAIAGASLLTPSCRTLDMEDARHVARAVVIHRYGIDIDEFLPPAQK